MNATIAITMFLLIVNCAIFSYAQGDGLTRDIVRDETQIQQDLARIRQDQAEESVIQSAVGNGGYGNGGGYGNRGGYGNGGYNQGGQWGRRR
jgi:hypothetical protein